MQLGQNTTWVGWRASQYIASGDTWRLLVPLLARLALILWLRWCLSGVFPGNNYFPCNLWEIFCKRLWDDVHILLFFIHSPYSAAIDNSSLNRLLLCQLWKGEFQTPLSLLHLLVCTLLWGIAFISSPFTYLISMDFRIFIPFHGL